MSVGPHFRINVAQIGRDHIGGRAELVLLAALHVLWHRRKPNIDVEADLMAGVLGKHRPAARLRHVANQKTVPANLFCVRANRSMKRMSCGLPQLRLRDGRMTCQVGPVIGSDTAPARQPSKSPPIERGDPRNGVDLRANSSLAGVEGASGFFSGGRGLGLSEPGSIGSIKCFCCATAGLAAARKRTARRQTTARIATLLRMGL